MQSRWKTVEGLWVVAGSLLGLLLGVAAAHLDRQHAAYSDMDRYADRLAHNGAEVREEVLRAIRDVEDDGFPFCSDAELAFMRQRVFSSAVVRDIGRTKNYALACTTGRGRLDRLIPADDFTAQFGDVRLFLEHKLILSPEARGIIYATPDVSVVLNPRELDSLNEPPYSYSGWLFIPQQHLALQALGVQMKDLRPEEVMRGRWVRRKGVLYRSVCSSLHEQCFVAAAPASLLEPGRGDLVLFGTIGMLLGAAITVSILLWMATQRSMERQLRRALRRGRLYLEYQPVVELATRRIVAVEALARWVRSNGDIVPPQVFIEIAEERGLIGELTRYVVQHALRDLGPLLDDGFRVMVNISAQDLADPGFPSFLARALSAAAVPASSLGLELTEHSTADQAVAVQSVQRLRAQGHPVYIDDFGTGYSSLAYLHQLSVDAIKIDRSFVQTVGTEAATASVVPQILAMAERLKLQVVVEGIETEAQAQYFAEASPTARGQGWCFGRPVPAALLWDLLRRTGQHTPTLTLDDDAALASLPVA